MPDDARAPGHPPRVLALEGVVYFEAEQRLAKPAALPNLAICPAGSELTLHWLVNQRPRSQRHRFSGSWYVGDQSQRAPRGQIVTHLSQNSGLPYTFEEPSTAFFNPATWPISFWSL